MGIFFGDSALCGSLRRPCTILTGETTPQMQEAFSFSDKTLQLPTSLPTPPSPSHPPTPKHDL